MHGRVVVELIETGEELCLGYGPVELDELTVYAGLEGSYSATASGRFKIPCDSPPRRPSASCEHKWLGCVLVYVKQVCERRESAYRNPIYHQLEKHTMSVKRATSCMITI